MAKPSAGRVYSIHGHHRRARTGTRALEAAPGRGLRQPEGGLHSPGPGLQPLPPPGEAHPGTRPPAVAARAGPAAALRPLQHPLAGRLARRARPDRAPRGCRRPAVSPVGPDAGGRAIARIAGRPAGATPGVSAAVDTGRAEAASPAAQQDLRYRSAPEVGP